MKKKTSPFVAGKEEQASQTRRQRGEQAPGLARGRRRDPHRHQEQRHVPPGAGQRGGRQHTEAAEAGLADPELGGGELQSARSGWTVSLERPVPVPPGPRRPAEQRGAILRGTAEAPGGAAAGSSSRGRRQWADCK